MLSGRLGLTKTPWDLCNPSELPFGTLATDSCRTELIQLKLQFKQQYDSRQHEERHEDIIKRGIMRK